MLGYDEYLLVSHSPLYILSTISSNGIKISDFEEVDDYNFMFVSSIFNRKKIKKMFPNISIVRSGGILSLFTNLLKYKIILFSLILSFVLFLILSSYIWKVNIRGNNEYINDLIYNALESRGIDKGSKLLDFKELMSLEDDIYDELKSDVEWLEIRQNGCSLNVSYLKRREEVDKEVSRGKIYASKDAIIHSIDVESGVVLVKENQYVRKGDLLVNDIVEISSGGFKEVYTKGSITGITWYVIEVEIKVENDEFSAFEIAMEKAGNELKKRVINIINVRSQNVLKYEIESSIVRLRIHYEVLEDISIT